MIQAILLAVGTAVSAYAGAVAVWELKRRVRSSSSVIVRIGDRDFVYTPEMTPDDFSQVLAKDFNERPKNGRRQEAAHS